MERQKDLPRSFDHSAVAPMAEYHALQDAMQDFAHALDEMRDPPMSRTQFVGAMSEMARALYAGDFCTNCPDSVSQSPSPSPFKAEVADGWMTGTYHCQKCGRVWTCGYSTDLRR